MAERDPFGRLPDENPLEFLGGRPSNGTEAAAAEAVAAEAVATEQAAPAERAASAERGTPADPHLSMADLVRPRTRTTTTTIVDPALVRRIARGVIGSAVLFALLVVVLAGVVLFAAGSDSDTTPAEPVEQSEQSAPESPSSNVTPPPPPAARPAATPRGLNARSLLTRRQLAPALRRLGRSGLGRLYSLSIRPERVDAQLLTRGGRLRSVQVRSDGGLNDFGTSGPGFDHLETTAFTRVQAGAPERLARGASERLHRPASQVDYVMLSRFGAELSWSVFMRDGKHFLADASGRITRRIS